ncbi:hypothetical protein I215_13832 [Galbibacter marinus]|uniref:AB hydrolase-1 domain-containing protein n=1 Tax=Galbibacter marinus TaxID=555500 RepID=K2PZV1_9FLAO|nr:alpha/beta fold hydrolase [Galbibacter marinus]EKF54151.1 hypothetical protein I215_13832 [Galbibacter marinus]
MKKKTSKIRKWFNALMLISSILCIVSCQPKSKKEVSTKIDDTNISIQKQGSFTVGGAVKTSPGTFDPIKHGVFNPSNQSQEGQTLHGDHAFVWYQIPATPKKLPLVFWHGYGQSMKTWQTTPDGREGFQTLFLKRDFSVYLIDQPRRGLAAQSTEPTTISAKTNDQLWFGIFRLGVGSELYPNVQFSKDPEALNQFFRQMTPDTGPLNIDLNVKAVSELFDKIGSGILVTHSHSGGMGWLTAIKNNNIKAVVSFEPGSNFIFPEGEVPEPISYLGGTLKASEVPMSEFKRLTKLPVVIFYGDNIPDQASEFPGEDQWRASLSMAKLWKETVNKHGGDVTLIHLPEEGIQGNTHFPMSDLNNVEIADLMSTWLQEKGLDM